MADSDGGHCRHHDVAGDHAAAVDLTDQHDGVVRSDLYSGDEHEHDHVQRLVVAPDMLIALGRDVERADGQRRDEVFSSLLIVPPGTLIADGTKLWKVPAPQMTFDCVWPKVLALAQCWDLESRDLGLPPLVGHDLRSSAATMG